MWRSGRSRDLLTGSWLATPVFAHIPVSGVHCPFVTSCSLKMPELGPVQVRSAHERAPSVFRAHLVGRWSAPRLRPSWLLYAVAVIYRCSVCGLEDGGEEAQEAEGATIALEEEVVLLIMKSLRASRQGRAIDAHKRQSGTLAASPAESFTAFSARVPWWTLSTSCSLIPACIHVLSQSPSCMWNVSDNSPRLDPPQRSIHNLPEVVAWRARLNTLPRLVIAGLGPPSY